MKRILCSLSIALMLISCESKPTMQKYFVEKSEDKGFSSVDIGTGIIKTDSLNLDAEQKAALKSVEHVNVLIYSSDSLNKPEYEKQVQEVKNILATDNYDELIKFNNGYMAASINTKGQDEHIEEFVVYLKSSENGFGLIRVTGDDMTPNNVLTIAKLLRGGAGLDAKQLEPLKHLFEQKKLERP